MEDRSKTLAAIAIIVGFLVFVVIVIGMVLNRKNLVSPIPEESVIKIIFVSPTPQNVILNGSSATTSGEKK